MSDNDDNATPVRVIMWGVPRSISSAFAKCMSGIDGMEIWFEPYTYCFTSASEYKNVTGKDLPLVYEGNEEFFEIAGKTMSRIVCCKIEPDRIAYSKVKEQLERTRNKYVFVKDMAFAVPDENRRKFIPTGYKHVFLMRHPIRAYLSSRKAAYKQLMAIGDLKGDARDISKFNLEVDENILPNATFYKDMHDLWMYIRESGIDPNPVIIEADDLLTNPSEVLPKFCEAVGFPYSESLLQWDASTDMVDTWNQAGDGLLKIVVNVYETAMKSCCFFPPSKEIPRDHLYPDVIRLSDASMKFYEEMYKHKM